MKPKVGGARCASKRRAEAINGRACNCPGWGLGSDQAEGICQGCRIAGQGVDDGPALLLGG
jgi:hypothetical protein